MRPRFLLPLLALSLCISNASGQVAPHAFTSTGTRLTPREFRTPTLLETGNVHVAGGMQWTSAGRSGCIPHSSALPSVLLHGHAVGQRPSTRGGRKWF